jgi:hypothetical protein
MTGREVGKLHWGEGLHVYSLDEEVIFDPTSRHTGVFPNHVGRLWIGLQKVWRPFGTSSSLSVKECLGSNALDSTPHAVRINGLRVRNVCCNLYKCAADSPLRLESYLEGKPQIHPVVQAPLDSQCGREPLF